MTVWPDYQTFAILFTRDFAKLLVIPEDNDSVHNALLRRIRFPFSIRFGYTGKRKLR